MTENGKLDFRSLSEQVYHRLFDEIINGQRPAGAKLTEEALCEELGVSRTPAREALMMLHRDGLVDRIPRRGCFVKAFDPTEIEELFECRIWIETLALKLGFDRISHTALADLENQLVEASEKDRHVSLEVDDQLHECIAEACPNRHLREFAHQLLNRAYPYRHWRNYGSAPVTAISQERLDIIRAILRKDQAAALQLLEAHITHGKHLIRQAAEAHANQP